MATAAILSVLLLAVNGAFVALEFALVGARHSRLEPLAEKGRRSAVLAVGAMRRLNLQLAGSQLGITLASLSLGYVAEPLVVHAIEDLLAFGSVPPAVGRAVSLTLGMSLVIFVHMVVGDLAPKNIAISAPERTLLVLARPNQWYLRVFGPLVWLLNALALAGVRLLRVTPRDAVEATPTADDLTQMLAQSHRLGLIEGEAQRLLTGVLDFGDRAAIDVMVPAGRIVTITNRTTVAEAEATIARTGHSRLPLVDATSGEPLGFVHAKDLLALSESVGSLPVPLRLVRRMPLVGPGVALDGLMGTMQRTGVHIALVVGDDASVGQAVGHDVHTGLSTPGDGVDRLLGLVTLEDLIEELVGDIVDETDRPALPPASGPGG